MAKLQISNLHTETKEIVTAANNIVDGEWIVFLDGHGLVSRKRSENIESIERIDN